MRKRRMTPTWVLIFNRGCDNISRATPGLAQMTGTFGLRTRCPSSPTAKRGLGAALPRAPGVWGVVLAHAHASCARPAPRTPMHCKNTRSPIDSSLSIIVTRGGFWLAMRWARYCTSTPVPRYQTRTGRARRSSQPGKTIPYYCWPGLCRRKSSLFSLFKTLPPWENRLGSRGGV